MRWIGASFQQALDLVIQRILDNVPIALVRFGDGELALMQGRLVGGKLQASQVDGWSAPAQMTELGRELVRVASNRHLIHGVPCECCNSAASESLKRMCLGDQTWANVFINANHARFIEQLPKLVAARKSVFLIANKVINGLDSFPISINGVYKVGSGCVTWFSTHKAQLERDMQLIAKRWHGSVIMVAAGPMSNVLVDWLWQANPEIQAVDIGSALDQWVHGRLTRPYQHEGNEYRLRVCR